MSICFKWKGFFFCKGGTNFCCCCSNIFLVILKTLLLLLGAFSLLANERFVDMRNDSSSSNGGLDECIQLLVTTDGELQMAGSDTLHLQILGGVASQLEDLSGQIFEDGSRVDGGSGSNTSMRGGAVFQMPVDTSHGELKSGPGRPRHCLCLCLSRILSCFASCHLGSNLRF